MKRLRENKAFTLLEMLLVLMVISVMLTITLHLQALINRDQASERQVKHFVSELNYIQAKAIGQQKTIHVTLNPYRDYITLYEQGEREPKRLPLRGGKILPSSNINGLTFTKDGHLKQFGRIDIRFGEQDYGFIFHIERGRFRIVKK
ncbi:competence type IV pilus minor pilin ComGD [Staphylococcus massiliensis]|uniref:competence type IV pilus minor pilin ComGD n=1 Tax=Staphylococcus massiliensis TaxID=555791 RepID=UPI001EDD1660|nr:competence type IV pilus minor pilin ComGD [Staphylococcus massiliensis]